MTERPRVGFIGLGAMGHGMAGNLVAKGFPTMVLGRNNRQPINDLVSKGATEARDAAELAAGNDVVILCVTDSVQVESIVYGDRGLLSVSRPGLLVIDTTTSDPKSTGRIFTDFAKTGADFVDAPMGRSVKEAAEGRLNVMVGAEARVLARAEPVLRAFSDNIFHVGGPGAGHKTKLVNNFLAMGHMALIAEALVAAGKAGVDIEIFAKILGSGPVNSPLLNLIVSSSVAGTYDGIKFGLDIARKDLRYYTHMVEDLVLPSVIGDAVHESFVRASSLGFGSHTVVGLVQAQEQIAGIRISKP